ncbi:hypothetical protein DFH07DRAFT_76845 [Mycena maculata]|uniref:Uncharacterized protein n=1 Tax=Mycena maculata TaxID=230809 RepID=A0AAD7IE18_9AGAR|nr:hypothetical protein DFH07DRAFT_76845 [Mycena maculata]
MITHPRLQTLEIRPTVDIEAFWSCLTCSALLTLSIETESQPPSGRGLSQSLTRSGGTIEIFTLSALSGSGLHHSQSIACMGALPLLRRLDVSEHGDAAQFTNEVWEALTLSGEGSPASPLVPNLENLSLTGCRSFRDKYVVNMLESRTHTSTKSPLNTMYLTFYRKINLAAHAQLETFGGPDSDFKIALRLGDEERSEASDDSDEYVVDSDDSGEDSDEDSDDDGNEGDFEDDGGHGTMKTIDLKVSKQAR